MSAAFVGFVVDAIRGAGVDQIRLDKAHLVRAGAIAFSSSARAQARGSEREASTDSCWNRRVAWPTLACPCLFRITVGCATAL